MPEGMTAAEVEGVMAGMAKLNQELTEDAPAGMDVAVPLFAGSFRDGDSFHRGSGQATIYRLADGSHVLRLEDFNVTNGPDLRVLLVAHSDPMNRDEVNGEGYAELGRLKGNIGSQNYEISDEIDLSTVRSVVIYCKPFQVVFSVAPLQEAG